ncbi:MAG: M48 family metalloprotease [Deltaproteobacteria bacterium]|jgi:predicted Zn-dependent protease|nr:M48 family metalloprotease [Deltaproteobacteria bacterium]
MDCNLKILSFYLPKGIKASLYLPLSLAIVLALNSLAHAIPLAEELSLGRQVHMEIAKEGVLFNDPYVNQYFQSVAAKVLKAAGRQEHPYHFYLILSDSLNAFAVPGGYIYFHTETLNSLENEGQMAAILAHEIAHITSRHFSLRAEKNTTASLASLAGILAGAFLMSQGGHNAGAIGQAMILGSSAGSIQVMLANSRADESEADRKGRSYMVKAGYNPRDMYGAFKIMSEKSFNVSSTIPTYMSTHPGISQRLASTFQDQAGMPPAPKDPTYLAMRDRVLALTAPPERATNIFNGRLAENPSDASALHALGLLSFRTRNLSRAEEYYNRALELMPNNGQYLSDMGDLAFERRKAQDAVNYYSKARQNGDNTPQTNLGLARSYELLGNNQEAARYYDAAVEAADNLFPKALEMAGLFFTTKGDAAKGHYILGNYFLLVGKPKDAAFHFEAAIALPQGAKYTSQVQQLLRDLEDYLKK